ncbi:interphotoreceptor matrix proteoglycan 2 [Gavia stellata]|uniref:interphotoreceptor matrix proteoglycan 2 n=1 Tax=Gavia stellata TaxID=37040 RepID=UPI0028A117F9|nr:interphotoreceptor matrix proteoglycan 2 [Gavia stellata]
MFGFIWKICLCLPVLGMIKGDLQVVAAEGYSATEGGQATDGSPTPRLSGWQLANPSLPPELKKLNGIVKAEQVNKHLLLRRKRSILFPSGIKICPDESVEQAIANHLKYFRLRVCQETVWEVFKTFWDRLPEHEEYHTWMNLCEEGTMSIFEMGTNFSQSEEHRSLIVKKLSYTKEAMSSSCTDWSCGSSGTPTPASDADVTTLRDAAANVPPPHEISIESPVGGTVHEIEDADTTINNEIKKQDEKLVRPVTEQMIEFSILIVDEKYSEELSDPASVKHQLLSEQFISQIKSVFEGLPGYKKIHVLDYSAPEGDSGVEVRYAVTFDGKAISNATWDLINLHSNKVEDNSFMDIEDNPTAVYTISDFRDYIAEILQKNALLENTSLSLDPNSLQLTNVKEILHPTPEDPSWITEHPVVLERPEFDDSTFLAERPSADESTVSNTLPFDFTKPDSTSDSEQSNDNEIRPRPENLDSEASLAPEAPLSSEADVTSLPDGLNLEDGNQTPHLVTAPALGRDSVDSLEWLSAPDSLDVFEDTGLSEDLLLPSSPPPHLVPEEPPSTDDYAVPLLSAPTVASSSAIEIDTKETVSAEKEEVTQGSPAGSSNADSVLHESVEEIHFPLEVHPMEDETDIYLGDRVIYDDGSGSAFDGSGKEMESSIWPWEEATLEPVFYPGHDSWLEDDNESLLIRTEDIPEGMILDYILNSGNKLDDDTSKDENEGMANIKEDFLDESEIFVFPETTTQQVPLLQTEEPSSVEPPTQTETSATYDSSFVKPPLVLESSVDHSFVGMPTGEAPVSQHSTGLSVEDSLLPSTGTVSMEQPEESSVGQNIISEAVEHQNEDRTVVEELFTAGQSDVTTIGHLDTSSSETILTADSSTVNPYASTEEQQTLDSLLAGQDTTGSAVKKPADVWPTDRAPENSLDQTVQSAMPTATQVSTAVSSVIDQSTALEGFTGQGGTDHDMHVSMSFSTVRNSYVTVSVTTSTAELPSHPAGPTASSSVVTSTKLGDEMTRVLDVSVDLERVSTVRFSPELTEEGRSMTESHVELTTHVQSTEMASVAWATHENRSSTAVPSRALVVFFSLRVTNMMFSEDLFNKNSPEYKALEQRFLELLVPYLQSNLTGFQNLEILNFRNGSIVVNSRMKFAKPVPRNVTNAVYMILEDFCNTAYHTMNLAIDKYSLDVESGEQADPCKFQACNEFSECLVNRWSGEAECVCNPGYLSIDGLPCNSICDLQPNFCLNDGKCDISPGQGAICRCRVGENWWYRGEHCEEYVSEPLVVGIAIASVAGFLLVASAVIFFLARTLRDQYTKSDTEDSQGQGDSLSSIENAVKYNPMYESDTTGYSHYYRRYPQLTSYSSTSAETSTDYSSEEIRHIYENSELTKEEIQDRIRIIELYAKDRQFAEFVRQHQINIMHTKLRQQRGVSESETQTQVCLDMAKPEPKLWSPVVSACQPQQCQAGTVPTEGRWQEPSSCHLPQPSNGAGGPRGNPSPGAQARLDRAPSSRACPGAEPAGSALQGHAPAAGGRQRLRRGGPGWARLRPEAPAGLPTRCRGAAPRPVPLPSGPGLRPARSAVLVPRHRPGKVRNGGS